MTATQSHLDHPYVSRLAASIARCGVQHGAVEITGTLAFFDVSGFTPLTERLAGLGRAGAEYINDVLNEVFTGLIDIAFRFGGDVLEFGGDAMVVSYRGRDHARRAAAASATVADYIRRHGRIGTPAGRVQLGVSCGMASGTQAFYVLGATRRALVVAGPVSTAMARLEAAACSGEVFIDPHLAAAIPTRWVGSAVDGGFRLAIDAVDTDTDTDTDIDTVERGDDPDGEHASPPPLDVSPLIPLQFRDLTDIGHRTGELKQVAVGFVRLTGTDDLLEREGVDAVERCLDRITDVVDRAATDLGVCWLETQAEANSVRWTLMAGAPSATEHDGERLLRVLRTIADRVDRPLRIGANLGVVFAGDMGHPSRCTYIVMGDTTNLAARLMGKAEPGQIVAGERLVASCPARFETVALEPFQVKGKARPITAHVVGDLRDLHGDQLVSTQEGTPLVGRTDELDRLVAAVGAGRSVEITATPGAGKSRLWTEARALTPERTWHVIRGEPHETGSPYLPVRRYVRHAMGLRSTSDSADVAAALDELVTANAPDLVPSLPLLTQAVGADDLPQASRLVIDEEFRAERTAAAMAELLVAIVAVGSVFVVEDGHWLDEASCRVIDVLCRLPPPRPSVVITRRPEGWQPRCDLTIELGPLESADAEALLLATLPEDAASDAVLRRLAATAGGNPLFLTELARTVAVRRPDSHEVYPETVERVVAARIDRLAAPDRALIRDAAALGARFDMRLAAAVLDAPDLVHADVWVERLGDLVQCSGDAVGFGHDMVRVAAYEGLAVRRRRAVHRRAVEVIETWGDGVPVADPVSALATHAVGADLPDRIETWCRRAADAAMEQGSMEIAMRFLRDVVQAERRLRLDASTRASTLRRLANAAARCGDPEIALDALERARRLSSGRVEQGEIAAERARVMWKIGRYRSGLVTTARALRSCDDPSVRSSLLLTRAAILNFRGDWAACLDVVEALLEDPRTGQEARAQAHVLAEWCCSALGRPGRDEHDAAAERLFTELRDSLGLGKLYLNRGVSAWSECRVGDATADFAASSEHFRRAGDVIGAALADNNLAEVLTLQHRLDDAEPLLVRARRVTMAADYPIGASIALSGLSRVRAWCGHCDEARSLQGDALRSFRELGAKDLEVDSLVRLAEIDVIAGRADDAFAAVELAESELAKLGELPILPATLARLRGQSLALAGRPDAARQAFDHARELSRRDGFTYEIALAELALAELDGDHEAADAALAALTSLGVLAPPPGLATAPPDGAVLTKMS